MFFVCLAGAEGLKGCRSKRELLAEVRRSAKKPHRVHKVVDLASIEVAEVILLRSGRSPQLGRHGLRGAHSFFCPHGRRCVVSTSSAATIQQLAYVHEAIWLSSNPVACAEVRFAPPLVSLGV